MATWSDRIKATVNAAIFVGVGVFLFRPGGPGTSALNRWEQQRTIRHRLQTEWVSFAGKGSRLGARNGTVRLIEFADYQCPVCRSSNPEVERFLREHPEVAMDFRHFPLRRVHEYADAAARAAICAEMQGRFAEMHRHLFERTEWDREPDWREEAVSAGVPDLDEFESCLDSPATSERLTLDTTLGARLGIHGTPSFVTPDGTHLGLLFSEELDSLLSGEESR